MRGLAEDRARIRRRRNPPHGLAEPFDLRRRRRSRRRGGEPPSRRSGLRPKRARSAPASSPAPAMPAASFADSDTKRHADEIARWCEARVALDGPINIHLTGCPNSCAQHYVGDIGLVGTQGADLRRRRPGRGLSHLGRRRLRSRCRLRPRNLSRCQGRGRAEDRRAHAEGLSRASRVGGGKLSHLHPPARDRRAEDLRELEAVE